MDSRDRPYVVIYHIALVVVLFIGFIRLENAGEHSQDNAQRIERAHDTLCVSHLDLLHEVGIVAAEALAPILPPSAATPEDLVVVAAVNKQKAEHLQEIKRELRVADHCPRL